ncbi:L,D-transpeptidase family protein [Saccharicrinis fermentans]|nr:L,D-transpeptidase family protein [Saccharicrinis fermentans]
MQCIDSSEEIIKLSYGDKKVVEGEEEEGARLQGGKFPTLTFDGNQLTIYHNGNETYSTKAYSGRPLEDGTFDYSVARQKMEKIGPIPEGTYFINGSKIQTMSTLDGLIGLAQVGGWPGGSFAWGEQRAWITPLTKINTDGRGGFSIHGGYELGSAGCIDLVGNVVPFFNNLQSTPGGNGMIMLKVRY